MRTCLNCRQDLFCFLWARQDLLAVSLHTWSDAADRRGASLPPTMSHVLFAHRSVRVLSCASNTHHSLQAAPQVGRPRFAGLHGGPELRLPQDAGPCIPSSPALVHFIGRLSLQTWRARAVAFPAPDRGPTSRLRRAQVAHSHHCRRCGGRASFHLHVCTTIGIGSLPRVFLAAALLTHWSPRQNFL